MMSAKPGKESILQDHKDGASRPIVRVSHADTKRLLAIRAHLDQLIRTAMTPERNAFRRPVEMDQGELLLASASLRALVFDNSTVPLLTGFLAPHAIEFEVETLETNLGIILLSQIVLQQGHVSDFLIECIFDHELKEQLKLDQASQFMIVEPSKAGFESMLRRSKVWAPTNEQDAEINSFLSGASNVGPVQMLRVTRRVVKLGDWGDIRLGYLKNIAITRKSIVNYVANRLGGVHYDSNRTPKDPDDLAQFRVLATAMDWEDQAIMHAGFVAVGIASIELLQSSGMIDLYNQCCSAISYRQNSIIERANQANSAGVK
jgi:hypothetical protein